MNSKEGSDGFEEFLNTDYVKAMNHSLLQTASKQTTRLWSCHLFYRAAVTKPTQ